MCQCACLAVHCRDQRFKLALEEKKSKLGGLVADPDPIAVCDGWFRDTFQNVQMAAASNGREDHNGIDHNAWGISAGAVAADLSSPVVMTNPDMREKLQTALGARSTITKDGVSIQTVRDRKRKEKSTLPADEVKAANHKQFHSDGGLAKSKLIPSAMRLAPPSATKPVINIADSTPSPPALSTNSSHNNVGERKSKLRRQIGSKFFSSNTRTQEHKDLHRRLLALTPSKTVKTLIGDSMAIGHDTPTILQHLKSVL